MKKKILVLALILGMIIGTVSAYNSPAEEKLFYHFNETSSPAIDYSGNNIDGVWNGDPAQVTGVDKSNGVWDSGKAYSFDGSDDHLNLGNPSELNFKNSGAMSITWWTKASSTGNDDPVFANWNTNSAYILKFSPGGGQQLGFWAAGSSCSVVTPPTSYTDGNWHHYALTYDGSTVTWYQDGSQFDSETCNQGFNDPGGDFKVGERGGYMYPHQMDGLHAFNKILSSNEIQNLRDYNCISGNCGNEAPSFDSVSTDPSNWKLNYNPDIKFNVSDDTEVSSVNLSVKEDGTEIVSKSRSYSSSTVSDSFLDAFQVDKKNVWYNATLTATDNDGSTATYEISQYINDSNPDFNIVSPQNKIYGTDTISWELNQTNDSDDVSNENLTVRIFENGTQKDSTSGKEGDNFSGTFTSNEGKREFKAEIEEDDGDITSKTVIYEVDTTPPDINITDPEGNLTEKKDLWLNYTIQDPNLDNSTCEYSKDGGTKFSISSCENTTIDFNTVGDHNVTVYASDTGGNTGSDTSFLTTHYENRISADDKTSNSAIQDFEVTFNNGTQTAGGTTSDGTFEINTSDLPYGDTNMTLKADGYKIKEVNLSTVDDSFELRKTYDLERASLTIDAKDEQNQGDLQFNFTARNSTTSYSQDNITKFDEDWQNLTSIGFPTGQVTLRVQDHKADYKERKYFITLDKNSVISVVAYLLEETEGIYISVETYDSNGDRLEQVMVTTQKQIGGSWKQVSQAVTGTDGSTSFFLDPDVQYRATASKTGYDTFEGTFNPVNYQYDPLKIQLGQSGKYNFSTRWDTVDYKLEPQDRFLNKSKTTNITWTVNDLQSDLTEYGLRIKYENGTTIKSKNVKNSPSGGKINISINGSNWKQSQEFHTEAYFITSGKEYRVEKVYEFARSWTAGIFSLSKILDTTGDGLSNTSRGLFALLVTAVVGAGFGSRLGKDGAGFVVIAVLGLFTIGKWFPWEIWTLTFLTLLGIYLYR